jgi:hypothetical protein
MKPVYRFMQEVFFKLAEGKQGCSCVSFRISRVESIELNQSF